MKSRFPYKQTGLLRYLYTCLLLLSSVYAIAQEEIPPPQNPPKLVNDFADVLSSAQAEWLENKLVDFDKTTSTQINIVLVKNTGSYSPAEYALEIGRRWGVGQKGKDNGVIILASIETRDVNISPGYGLEGVLPDVLCKQIIEYEIVPSFRDSDYYNGLDRAIDKVMSATKGEFTREGPYGSPPSKGLPRWLVLLIVIVGINAVLILVPALLVRLYYWITGKKPPKRKQRDYWTYSTQDVQPGSSTEESSSSSGSSSGFGGYGGGSFGGGGASGKW